MKNCPKCQGWMNPEKLTLMGRTPFWEWTCMKCGKVLYSDEPPQEPPLNFHPVAVTPALPPSMLRQKEPDMKLPHDLSTMDVFWVCSCPSNRARPTDMLMCEHCGDLKPQEALTP